MNAEGECTTLTPEMLLEEEENRVETSEWTNCLLHKSIVILKVWRKSNPKIGLETWAMIKGNEYDLLPIFICLFACPKALIGVPLVAVNHTSDSVSFVDDEEGGQLEILRPVGTSGGSCRP